MIASSLPPPVHSKVAETKVDDPAMATAIRQPVLGRDVFADEIPAASERRIPIRRMHLQFTVAHDVHLDGDASGVVEEHFLDVSGIRSQELAETANLPF